MDPATDWYDLQLRFAERAAALTGRPFEETLLHYTNCYRRCGLGQSRNPDHPIWRAYLLGLRKAADRAAWTADYCRAHAQPEGAEYFGCFHYDYFPQTRTIRLHFANNDDSGAGPLSQTRLSVRRAELHTLFTALARAHPEAQTVRGVSWLHGTPAYRRIFPQEYGQSARPLPTEQVLPSMPLWGQFLDHSNRLKVDLVRPFLAHVAQANTFSDLVASFPLQVYAVESSISHFHRFYAVPHPAVPVLS